MTCDECHREHVITGSLLVDGVPFDLAAVEVVVALLCKYGRLVRRDERIASGASSDEVPIHGSYREALDEPNVDRGGEA